MRLLYTVVFYLSLPLVLIGLLWRGVRAPEYRHRWGERFGWFAPLKTEKSVVWLHTVSVGEFLGALPMIRALLQQPELQLVITTSTPTASERVRALLGERVFHVYAPCDLPDSVQRFLVRIQPRLLVIMETELWPNTIAACAKREIPVLLINARLSARSAQGYQRFGPLVRPMLARLSQVAAQHQDDAARLCALGVAPDNCSVTGNIKFDLQLDEATRSQAMLLKDSLSLGGERLIWIAASTHLGEDEQLLEAFSRVRQSTDSATRSLLLILVPRHPERFERVAQLCENRQFTLARRSSGAVPGAEVDVLLGDTMGELLMLFGASDFAFMGGSLVPNGGHNLIEPAAWGLPLLSGPHLFNFSEVSRLLRDAGGLQVVETVEALAVELECLVCDAERRRLRGGAALAVAEANRGALEKTLVLIRQYL